MLTGCSVLSSLLFKNVILLSIFFLSRAADRLRGIWKKLMIGKGRLEESDVSVATTIDG